MIFGSKPKLDDLPVYMAPGEFAQVRAIVETLAPKNCLEWGAGGSTRALLASCEFIERYVAVEHNPAWVEKVAKVVRDPRLSLHLVGPDGAAPAADASQREREAWDMRAETDPELMRSYVPSHAASASPSTWCWSTAAPGPSACRKASRCCAAAACWCCTTRSATRRGRR
jgi:hypothetical protein